MKSLLAMCLFVVATCVRAGEMPAANAPAAGGVKGTVLEVKNVSNFTYMRLKTRDGEIWAAVVNAAVKEGATVTIENPVVMENFESKALKRTFPRITFGSLGGSAASSGAATSGPAMSGRTATRNVLGTAYPTIPRTKLDTINDEHIPKAQGADARTVAEIVKQAAALKDKPVVVRGKVVKYNPDIMGRNWLHLRDGSGSAADETNDILVTTKGKAGVGDVVTAKGIVRLDKDFGAGYAYKVLIEEATLK